MREGVFLVRLSSRYSGLALCFSPFSALINDMYWFSVLYSYRHLIILFELSWACFSGSIFNLVTWSLKYCRYWNSPHSWSIIAGRTGAIATIYTAGTGTFPGYKSPFVCNHSVYLQIWCDVNRKTQKYSYWDKSTIRIYECKLKYWRLFNTLFLDKEIFYFLITRMCPKCQYI